MKRLSLLSLLSLSLFVGLPAEADIPATIARGFEESQALTRAAPSAATEGMLLTRVAGYRVSICAASGQTLSGAGSLQAYYFDPAREVWIRNPTLDRSVTVSGSRCQAFPDATTLVRFGRVLYATSSVTVSGGTTVTVRIDAYLESR